MSAPPPNVIDLSSKRSRDVGPALPHNLDAEQSIIGGVIIDNANLALLDDLEVDDFFDLRNRTIFAAIRNLEVAASPIDSVTIETEIERLGKLDAVGGIAYIAECTLRCPIASNIVAYKVAVRQHATNRKVAIALGAAAERARNWPHDGAEMLDELLGDLERIKSGTGSTDASRRKTTYGSPFKEWIGDAEPSNNPAEIFDAHGLIVRGEPCLFLGDPKVGKTLLITDLALHLAAGRSAWCGVPLYRRCRVLSLLREDSERTTRRRVYQMARAAGIRMSELEGWLEVDGVTPLYFDDPRNVAQLRRQAKNFDIVLIDSLSTVHNGDENSVESMAPVMNEWRDIALGTKVAIPIIHHFRKRPGERMQEAGGVLQRARGSSIIGATTRHAVGISTGPEKNQVVIEVESNHEIDFEPFVIERTSGLDNCDRAILTHRRIGSLSDARREADTAVIDPITLRVIRSGGADGIGGRDLRSIVVHELELASGRGCRPAKVDQSARRLADRGQVEQSKTSRKWRALA